MTALTRLRPTLGSPNWVSLHRLDLAACLPDEFEEVDGLLGATVCLRLIRLCDNEVDFEVAEIRTIIAYLVAIGIGESEEQADGRVLVRAARSWDKLNQRLNQ